MSDTQRAKCAAFAQLHNGPGASVIPNPCDAGSALHLGKLGFKALATSSARAASTLGKPDGGVERDVMLAHIAAVASASPLPVNAGFEACFGADEAGARRVSAGSPLARSAWGGFMQAAREIAAQGSFNALSQGAPVAEVSALFGGGED